MHREETKGTKVFKGVLGTAEEQRTQRVFKRECGIYTGQASYQV
jgi:hypothetical protein